MSNRGLVDADTVVGTATTIAKLVGEEGRPVPINTLTWLHAHGLLPGVARLGPLWIMQCSVVGKAKERARLRGEIWAQPASERRLRRARQPKREEEYA